MLRLGKGIKRLHAKRSAQGQSERSDLRKAPKI
jgi:hypothetical protein